MLTPTAAPWTVRGASFALWALAAASVVYWGFRLGGGSSVKLPAPVARQAPPVDPAAIARLLGAAPGGGAAPAAAPSLASRLQLVGVVAGVSSGGGAAIISVDGKPAKPFRVGAAIEDGVVLQSVRGRQAVLAAGGAGAPLLTLELPPLRGTAVSQAPISPAPPGLLSAPPLPPAQPPMAQPASPPATPAPQAQGANATLQAQTPASAAPSQAAGTTTQPAGLAAPVPGAGPQAPITAPR
jgi:general secretion pathway protein C